jgi:hypothetical protein
LNILAENPTEIYIKVRLYADEYNGVIKKKILANRVMTRMGLDDNLRERCI